MAQVGENFQTLADRLVTLAVFDIDDETNTAGVVFVTRVVETLVGGDLVKMTH